MGGCKYALQMLLWTTCHLSELLLFTSTESI
jgi:hypothetical protein